MRCILVSRKAAWWHLLPERINPLSEIGSCHSWQSLSSRVNVLSCSISGTADSLTHPFHPFHGSSITCKASETCEHGIGNRDEISSAAIFRMESAAKLGTTGWVTATWYEKKGGTHLRSGIGSMIQISSIYLSWFRFIDSEVERTSDVIWIESHQTMVSSWFILAFHQKWTSDFAVKAIQPVG